MDVHPGISLLYHNICLKSTLTFSAIVFYTQVLYGAEACLITFAELLLVAFSSRYGLVVWKGVRHVTLIDITICTMVSSFGDIRSHTKQLFRFFAESHL